MTDRNTYSTNVAIMTALVWAALVWTAPMPAHAQTAKPADTRPQGIQGLPSFDGPLAARAGRDLVKILAHFSAASDDAPARLFITAEIRETYHVYSLNQSKPLQKTKIQVIKSDAFKLKGSFQATVPPKIKVMPADAPVWPNVRLEEHHGTVTWYAPIDIAPGTNLDTLDISGVVDLQVCDPASCVQFSLEFAAKLGPAIDVAAAAASTPLPNTSQFLAAQGRATASKPATPKPAAPKPTAPKLAAKAQVHPQQAKSIATPDATASEELKEGWRRTIPIPLPILGEGDTYVIWVEKGWLHVKRRMATGETDWHIVLARATDPTPPTVLAEEGSALVEFSYRDGRYFIREDVHVLRCIREIKRGEDGTWPRSYFLNDNFSNTGSAGGPPLGQLSGWRDETWLVAATGPTKERFDCIVRLVPIEMRNASRNSSGFGNIGRELRRMYGGDALIMDDGKMLVATRTLEFQYKEYLVKEHLPGSPAPALDGTAWLNTEGPLAWRDLRGKVVLLDFWGTWCRPCVEKMPDVQALHEKYQDKGLVVIGVHTAQAAETCEEFAEKNNITFPLVLDTGKTAEHYAVSGWPSYILIDKTGRVTAAASTRLPEEQEIERLLSQ